MHIALDKDVEDFLQNQVRAGVCAAPGEFVNDLVRSISEQQQKPFDLLFCERILRISEHGGGSHEGSDGGNSLRS